MPKCGRRNEHPEFEFLSHPKEGDLILKNAPFGTTHTPSTRMKIVGGKPVYFIDSGIGPGGSSSSPRAVVKGVSAKPNEIDPWEIKQPGYSTSDKDIFNSQIHQAQKNGHLINPYRVIPPINNNSPSPRGDVNFNNNINNNNLQFSNQGQTSIPYQYDTSQSYPPLSEKERLLRLLPRTEYLPRKPLQLAKEDEYRLLSLLNDELRELEAQRLKDIYVDLTSFDKQLRGFCLLQDLSYVLGKHGIFLSPDILRLVACQYVSDHEDGKVNYEKILSFFGAALRTSQSPTRQIQTMVSPGDRPKPMTPPNDSELSKLVRLVEQQLLDSDVEIDFDRLALDFRKMDPNHRGTMSAAQVKQIVYSPAHQIPLQESLVNQILSKCDHHGDGQYQWMQFIEFLEKVQPRQTGLILPKSKRPLEYAKNYGNPSSNWPHAETPRAHFQPKVAKQEHMEEPTRRTPLPTYARDYNGNQSQRYEETGRISQRDVERKEQELRSMEREYEVMKSQLAEEEGETEPWFQRFLKLASSVYSQDTDNSGYLPYDEVKKLIRLYNDAYNLRLHEHDIDRAMMDNFSKGKVAIHPILTVLGAKST